MQCVQIYIFHSTGITLNVANINSDIELTGTTTSAGTGSIDNKLTLHPSVYCPDEGMTTSLDEASVATKEVVIGSIDSDVSTLQLLVSGNAKSKDADASCSQVRHGMHSPLPIAHNQEHVHEMHSNIAVKNEQINLRRITDLDIDLWMAPKPTTYPDDKRPTKPVYKSMHKDDPNKSNESTYNPSRMDKQTMKMFRKHDKDKNQKTKIKVTVRSEKKLRSTDSSNKPSIKWALGSKHGSDSTPVPSSRRTRTQKIRSGAKSPAFLITVHGLKKF